MTVVSAPYSLGTSENRAVTGVTTQAERLMMGRRGAVLSHIRERQIERAEARSQSAPRRQGQIGHMFKVG